jgi:hypothetical protein
MRIASWNRSEIHGKCRGIHPNQDNIQNVSV